MVKLQELTRSDGAIVNEDSQAAELARDINKCIDARLPCFCKERDTENTLVFRCSCPKNLASSSDVGVAEVYTLLSKKDRNVDERWVRTHFRQIVWKLACYSASLTPRDCPVNK